MNETWIWKYVFLGERGVHTVLTLYYKGWLVDDDAWLQSGEGGSRTWEKVIT